MGLEPRYLCVFVFFGRILRHDDQNQSMHVDNLAHEEKIAAHVAEQCITMSSFVKEEISQD